MTPPASPDHLHSRRGFLRTTGTAVAASALSGVVIVRMSMRREAMWCRWRWSAAAGAAPARPPTRCRPSNGPIKLVAMADVFEDRLKDSYETLQQEDSSGQVDVPDRPQVHRLRRLQAGDGLPEAGRRRHLHHAAGLPLGPLHLRDREGPECLHGEAGDGRTAPPRKRMLELGEEASAEEPQGRRRPDVPPQPGAAGAAQADSRRRDRRHHPACAATACTGRSALPFSAKWPGTSERTALADPALPQLPLGERRLLQRLLHSPHRPLAG